MQQVSSLIHYRPSQSLSPGWTPEEALSLGFPDSHVTKVVITNIGWLCGALIASRTRAVVKTWMSFSYTTSKTPDVVTRYI